MDRISQLLEFDEVKNRIAQLCASSLGSQAIKAMYPFNMYTHLQMALNLNEEGLALYYAHHEAPLGGFFDIYAALENATIDGILSIEALLNIASHVYVCANVLKYSQAVKIKAPRFIEKVEALTIHEALKIEIDRCISDIGEVKESASSMLGMIRKEVKTTELTLRQRLDQFLQSAKDHISESLITVRNDRFVVPIKSSSKSVIKGIIHAESASGQTIYIEPEVVIDLNNRLQQLRIKEIKEIERILFELSQLVKIEVDTLYKNMELLIEIDTLFAKAKYAKQLQCQIPKVRQDSRSIVLKGARHPLIDAEMVVANDIIIEAPKQMMLITGSNTGGKTVTLKTVGLLSMMALCGLALPVKTAVMPYYTHIFCDLGDGQSIEQSLSTFSAHIKKMIEITEHVDQHSLVLLDELGSGTDPVEGENLAMAILNYLHYKGATVIATTHYAKLKTFAKMHEYIQSASVIFDLEQMKPTYELALNTIGQSYAMEIASRLGLNHQIIEQALLYKTTNEQTSDKMMETLEAELTQTKQLNEALQTSQKVFEEEKEAYQIELKAQQKKQEMMFMDAQFEANKLIQGAQKQVAMIIKEAKSLVDLKQHEVNALSARLDHFVGDIPQTVGDISYHYDIGDYVKIISLNKEAQITKILNNNTFEVRLGALTSKVKKKDIVFSRKNIKKKVVSQPRIQRPHIKLELNIIGKNTEEGIELVDQYIYQAILAKVGSVRIIHGHGTGVLRKAVHEYLKKQKQIDHYRLGDSFEGGVGATVVYFK